MKNEPIKFYNSKKWEEMREEAIKKCPITKTRSNNVINYEYYKSAKDVLSKKDSFYAALDILSKQNGVNYRKMYLGTKEEKQAEHTKLKEKIMLHKEEE